eukprot:7385061-Lingulodinium_polyedra.AAC.1
MNERLPSATARKDHLSYHTRSLNGANRANIGAISWACHGCVAKARIRDRRHTLSAVWCQRVAR